MLPAYILGLDLGQSQDFTALAALERHPAALPADKPDYALRHLRRFPLGTPYTAIVPAMAALRTNQPLREAPLVVDQTGVGRAVVDMLRQSAGCIVPVTITGGHAVTRAEDGSFHVPKKELVTALQVVLQAHRLQIARGLPDAAALVRELQQFQVKITVAANETFGVWRDGQHDDLVLAVALACWWAERTPPFEAPTVMPLRGGARLLERMARTQTNAQRSGLFGLGRSGRNYFL
jgi:hypothetical protein